LTEVPAEFLFTLTLTGAAQPDYAFDTAWGRRRETRVKGGRFEGRQLSGVVLEGLANDWGTVSSEGTIGIDSNIVLRTDDGEPLFMTCRGRGNGGGKFRIAPMFEASDGPLAWLTEIQAVGVGEARGDDLVFKIYAVK
jgi:hypothetical protein